MTTGHHRSTPAFTRRRAKGFTLGETVALILVVILLVALVLPMLGRQRRTASGRQNSTHVRGIHSGLVLYAQGNRDFFPGLDSQGNIATASLAAQPDTYGTASTNGADVVYRMTLLLRANMFSPDYMQSPAEVDAGIVTPTLGVDMLPGQNYSYAMLNISQLGAGRNDEWRATNNSRAALVSDRNIGGPGSRGNQLTQGGNPNAGTSNAQQPATVQSIHTAPGQGWRGSVCYNDNRAVFEFSDLIKTSYGLHGSIDYDGLFNDREITDQGIPNADAAMVFKDNVTYEKQGP